MLILEIESRGYYMTTTSRADVVLAIRYLTRELDCMEREGTEGRTVYDFHETTYAPSIEIEKAEKR